VQYGAVDITIVSKLVLLGGISYEVLGRKQHMAKPIEIIRSHPSDRSEQVFLPGTCNKYLRAMVVVLCSNRNYKAC
jgi:hypothetical protein